MAIIETEIDLEMLNQSGKRGKDLVDYAYDVLEYDGEKLLHVAIHAGSPHVNTKLASSMLGFQQATLHNWSSNGNGALQPMRLNGKPYWRIRDIRRLLE